MSPCDGEVIASASGNRTGNNITIKCKTGETFRYMHLNNSPPKAKAGKKVKAGTVVGGVGNTGNARRQAPHLHLEYRDKSGRRQDPTVKLWPSCKHDSGM